MEYIDISRNLYEGMRKHTSQEPFVLEFTRSFETGENMRLSHFSMSTHLGTHIDAPSHFVKDGKWVDEIDLNLLMGNCQIVEVPKTQVVNQEFVLQLNITQRKVLFSFTEERLDRKIPYFSVDGVEELVKKGVKTIGTDNLMVDTPDTASSIHKAMLGHEMMIVEGLDFTNVKDRHKIYQFICLPLAFVKAEGAPARAILI